MPFIDTIDPRLLTFLAITLVWVIPWKGYALWLSAKRGDKIWFVILLLVNTLAILEIVYIFFFAKKKKLTEKSKL